MVCTEPGTLIDTLRQEGEGILVMPGGRDKPYQDCLAGEGVQAIKEFVGGGGHYLGICAGAYFASGRVVFEKGTEMEVDEDRDLKFFPGTAFGTMFKGFVYNSEEGAHAVNLGDHGDGPVVVYYNGGCCFQAPELYDGVTVVARYEDLADKPAAVIKTGYGGGSVLLSGPHWEVGAEGAREEGSPIEVVKQLEAGEIVRKNFVKMLIELL